MSNIILLVDDDVLVLKTLRMMLSRKGYSVETSKGGNDAYEKCSRAAYSLVICDIRMPEMDGVEFVKKLRSLDLKRGVLTPVIFITGYADVDAAKGAESLNAVDYILKPFDLDRMCNSVRKALSIETE